MRTSAAPVPGVETRDAAAPPPRQHLDAIRLRREAPTRDAVNARLWSSVQLDRHEGSGNGNGNGGPRFMDMAPTASRATPYPSRGAPELFPSVDRPRDGAGAAQAQPQPLPPMGVAQTAFLARMDTRGEAARHVARELRGAVVEDTRERDVDASRRMTERQFQHQWLEADAAARMASLTALEALRPQPDDYRTSYRPGGGAAGQTGGGA